MASRGVRVSTAIVVTALLLVKLLLYASPALPQLPRAIGESRLWAFDAQKHAHNRVLSHAQCYTAFPRLFDRIESAVLDYEQSYRTISQVDIQIVQGRCMLQVLIHEAQVYVTDTGDHLQCYVPNGRERIIATLSLIQQAVTSSPEPLPNVEFPISYDDLPTRSTQNIVWGFTRREEEESVWLLPDYGYWAWWAIGIPSFHSVSRAIKAVDTSTPWKSKTPKAVWRGSPALAPELRDGLLSAAKNKSWADVRTVIVGSDEVHYLGLDQHCQYQYLLQIEGTSYTGRFKFLQLCNSVIVSHKLDFAEFATHLMQPSGPHQNFVQVRRDWSDLDEKMRYYTAHPDEAEAIARRSHELFAGRYLTPAAVSCYIREMIHGWARIQGFQPELYNSDNGDGYPNMRGVPFEAFVVSFPQKKPGEYGRFAPSSNS